MVYHHRSAPAPTARPRRKFNRPLLVVVTLAVALAGTTTVTAWAQSAAPTAPGGHPAGLPKDCAAQPSACGYPDGTNTGVPAGTSLKRVPQDITSGPGWHWDTRGWIAADTDGAVVSGISTAATVDVTAAHVVVKNVEVHQPNGDFGVAIDGTAFTDATLPVKLSGGGRVTFSEFTGTTENVRIESPADVEWNYVHNPKRRTAGGAAHSYGLTVTTGGGPVTVAHNWIDMSGAEGLGTDLNIVSDFGTVDGVRVEDNTFMPGGSYTLYVRTDGYCRCGTVRNVRVVGNRWYGDAAHVWGGQYGAFSVNDEASVAAWSGNTLTKAGARPIPLPLANTQP